MTTDLKTWLTDKALPLWSKAYDADGFYDFLTPEGSPLDAPTRALVQARMAYVFSQATKLGLGDYDAQAKSAYHALTLFEDTEDGFYFRSTEDQTPRLYDQAFALFAMAHVSHLIPQAADEAIQLAAWMRQHLKNPIGGYQEFGGEACLANSNMHILEAFLAWYEVDPEGPWEQYAREIAELAMWKMSGVHRQAVFENFNTNWQTTNGIIEPGHQFEWASLLLHPCFDWPCHFIEHAFRIVQAGECGVRDDLTRNQLDLWLTMHHSGAKLWQQTERLKARAIMEMDLTGALKTVTGALRPNGTWTDCWTPEGEPIIEPCRASSLYHIVSAYETLHYKGLTGPSLEITS